MDSMMGKPPDGYEWSEMHNFQSPPLQSPVNEYGGYGFAVSPHDIPHESPFGRHPAQMYAPAQQPQPVFPTQWPSMLANATMQHQPQPHPPPHPVAQMGMQPPLARLTSMPVPQHHPQLATHQQTPTRRTLTDQDRRRMCQYHEDNPSVKQTEIGAMFGVERSTVSKVLRQKEKYLFPEDGSRSPIKKAKGKFPDIERALSNWVRNHEKKGLTLNDKDIREKARFFAATVGNVDSYDKLNSTSWLEKFKQKNGLLGNKSRLGSEANDSDAGYDDSGAQTPNGVSPTSPNAVASPSPISPGQNVEGTKAESAAGKYNLAHSQSVTSLGSGFSETQGQPQSPGSFYSSEASVTGAPYMPTQRTQMIMSNAGSSAHRIRSQTFPVLGVDPSFGALSSGEGSNMTPKQMQEMLSNTSLDTPLDEYPDRSFSISSADLQHLSQPTSNLHSPATSGSPSVMGPPAHSVVSAPGMGAPSQDEARRALELVMQFFQHQPTGVVDPEEYITMGKLMEKLKVQGAVGELPGGMRSIDPSHQEVSRKRSIHNL